jgi:hypothetical protein
MSNTEVTMTTGKSKNEGEGNRTADRHYRNAATKYAESGASEAAARDAEDALEGKEGKELAEAEAAGKARKSTPRKHH